MQFASVNKLVSSHELIHAYVLDFPAHDKEPRLSERGLYLQGWVLEQADVERGDLQLRTADGETRALPFNNDRADVIQRVLGVAPEGHPQKKCGFMVWVKNVQTDFELGVVLNGHTEWLWQVQLGMIPSANSTAKAPRSTQVIEGRDGWLYLDNDTNRSVEQYTGQLTLDADGLEQWRAYLDQCAALAAHTGSKHAVVISASKEQVLPEHYPHSKGAVTLHDQVLALCLPKHHVQDTAGHLSRHPDRDALFIKTDTHWTDRGAKVAVMALLDELGADMAEAEATFADDVYYTMPFAGDLGVKMQPALTAATEFLQTPPASQGAAYDNQLANIGRVMVFEDATAPWQKSVLMFGASSSYPMLKYLKRLFGRIVFIHSAGSVDPSIVAHEQPDMLVMQTTARFMIEPPRTDFDLRKVIANKISQGSDRAHPPLGAFQVSEPSGKNVLYHALATGTA